jgi:hypothetical protein
MVGTPPFEVLILSLACCQADPPTVIVDDDVDVVGIVERLRGAIERGLVEVPARRSNLPDEPGKITPVFVVASPATFRGKIELVPPLQLSRWAQWRLVGLLATDQVAAHRDDRPAPLRPEGRHDPRRSGSPVEAADDRSLDAERVHERDDVNPERRLLAVAQRRL